MKLRPKKKIGSRGATIWNNMDAYQRFNLVLRHQVDFMRSHLINPKEVEVAKKLPSSSVEYIIEREVSPIFRSINIKCALQEQFYEKKLRHMLNRLND
jgi:hypothetical protein